MVDLLPRYYDAQTAVIGSIMIDARALPVVMAGTSTEDFASPEYATVYEAARRLWLERRPVDPVTVLAETGPGYEALIRRCMEETPTAANAEAYCRILREDGALYRLRKAAAEILDAADLPTARSIYDSAARYATAGREGRRVSLQQGLQDWYADMCSETPADYLDWGIDRLNSRVKVSPGDFVVLGADSSVGKTALAVQLAYSMAASGKRVGLYSAETGAATLYRRLVAQRAGVPIPAQQAKIVGRSQYAQVTELMRTAAGYKLDVVDASDMSLEDLRADVIAQRYDVIWLDYIQLLDAPGRNSVEEVRYISKYLHKMARALGVVVIGLSQLTVPDDAKDDWVPTKESLRESRQLKNDADVIMLMYLVSRKATDGARRLKVVKNKEGGLGQMTLAFKGQNMTFSPQPSPRERLEEQEQMKIKEAEDAAG